MARPRNPARAQAMELFLQSDGNFTSAEIVEQLGNIRPAQIRKWKNMDGWNAALEEQLAKRKRGAQQGNKNAVGAGAPYQNKNSETHGAYSAVHFAELPADVQESIMAINADPSVVMLEQLRTLKAKEYHLQSKINELGRQPPDTFFTDRAVEMRVPDKGKDKIKTAMTTIVKASPFDRARKLEAELNKVQGRIIKLIDSMRNYELEQQRHILERRKYSLMKQRLSGAYDIDPDTGAVNDDLDVEQDEDDVQW